MNDRLQKNKPGLLHCLPSLLALLFTSLPLHAEDIAFGQGRLSVTPLTENAVRIRYCESRYPALQLPELIYQPNNFRNFKVQRQRQCTRLRTSQMTVLVDPTALVVSVLNQRGDTVLTATRHQLRSNTAGGEACAEALLRTRSPRNEMLFGLGQFQDGNSDLRGLTRRLTQVNTQISIPMYLSSRGYGLLWNNYGLTDFNPADQSVSLTKTDQAGEQETVDVTSTQGGRREVRVRNIFQGEIDIPADGTYSLLLDVGQTMARRHNLSIDGQCVLDVRNVWLPPTSALKVHLSAGRHVLTAELERNDKPQVYFRAITDETILRSPVADAVDYTVFVGSADEVISAFRHVSGNAPLMPRWAMGYIHCRERFHSSDEILQTAQRFRSEQIPVDVLVQDWQWWGKYGWNAMRFDEDHYPDPAALTRQLHSDSLRLMLSVWSKIDRNSELGKQVDAHQYYIPGTDWIDFFNPAAAAFYWKNFSARLLRPYHIDAWWQDATEPENDDLLGRRVMGGKLPGEFVRNCYPLMVNKTVYEGLRSDDPGRRTMILTRCAFPGIQRYAAATWSGDVGNDFETLRRQVIAGLGMQAAGQPWWTFDAGGFFRPGDQYTNKEYIQRMLRWIETSVYLPLMRVHGYMSNTEPWNYGPEAQRIITSCVRQRYRLLPYIYSCAARVTLDGYTLMRPLLFDFPTDRQALQQPTQYMFGPALLVCPVTEADVTSWSVYLPQTAGGWYDLRSGRHYDGGQRLSVPVDQASIPVFVRGGSLLVTAEGLERSGLLPRAELTIHVFPGADGEFTIYDDEGTNYNYEQGQYSQIPLQWNQRKRQLTIGQRSGSFAGMSAERRINVVLPDGSRQAVSYTGKAVRLTLK